MSLFGPHYLALTHLDKMKLEIEDQWSTGIFPAPTAKILTTFVTLNFDFIGLRIVPYMNIIWIGITTK